MGSTKRRRVHEDDDDPPRKQKKKESSRGIPVIIFVIGGAGLALVLLVIVVSVGLYFGLRNPGNAAGPGGQMGSPKDPKAELDGHLKRVGDALNKFEDDEGNVRDVMQRGMGIRFQVQDLRQSFNAARTESKSWRVPQNEAAKKHYQCFQEYLTLYEPQVQWWEQVMNMRESGGKGPLPPQPGRGELTSKRRQLWDLAGEVAREIKKL